MPGFGLCGESYTTQSSKAANQFTKNWYPEVIAAKSEQPRIVLAEAPGVSSYATAGLGPFRGLLNCLDDRIYLVSRAELFAVNSFGAVADIGAVPNVASNSYVSMAASPTQLMIVVDGLGYYVVGGVLTQITDPDFPANVITCNYSDGYFIAVTKRRAYVSDINDVTSWNALEFTTVQASANDLVSSLVYNRRLIIFGTRIAQVFDNTGNLDFPYQADASGIIAYGLAATFGLTLTSTGFLYLVADERGNGIIVNHSGRKASSAAVDFAIQEYSRIDDCVAFAFQLNGHEFAQFSFPNARATWRYDVGQDMWHEAPYWNTATGQEEAHLGLFHSFSFGKHLLGSRRDGTLMELSADTRDALGSPIRRLRRCPHVRDRDQNGRLFADKLEIIADVGQGLSVNAGQPGHDPQLVMRFSGDGGKSWSEDESVSMGKSGEYDTRLLFNNLGSGHDLVIEIEYSDVAPCRIVDGLLTVGAGG